MTHPWDALNRSRGKDLERDKEMYYELKDQRDSEVNTTKRKCSRRVWGSVPLHIAQSDVLHFCHIFISVVGLIWKRFKLLTNQLKKTRQGNETCHSFMYKINPANASLVFGFYGSQICALLGSLVFSNAWLCGVK